MCPTFKVVYICVCTFNMVVVCVHTYTYKPPSRYHIAETLIMKGHREQSLKGLCIAYLEDGMYMCACVLHLMLYVIAGCTMAS